MKPLVWASVACFALFVAVAGCQRSDREAARQRAERIKNKAEAAAKEAGQEARKFGQTVEEKARQAGATRESGTGESPEEKLKRRAAELKREGEKAGEKLAHASQSAKVKYNLTAALGLSAVTEIDVDSNASTVTLRGSVPTPDQKAEAERVALRTDGVTKVVNELRVQP